VTYILDGVVLTEMSVCKDGVLGIADIRSPDLLASADHDGMLGACAAFCVHDVVVAVLLVDVRSFGPDAALESAVPYILLLALEAPALEVYLSDIDIPVAVILCSSVGILVSTDVVALSVIVEEEGRVDTVCLLEVVRLGPGSFGTCRSNDEVAAVSYVSADNIENAVIVTDRGSKESLGMISAFERELRVSVEHVSDLLPVHEVLTVHHGQSGEISESGITKVVILSDRTDRRVGIESGHYRIRSKDVF
jgi:hypothetical protein